MHEIKLVIFDYDGTLVESEYINKHAMSKVLMGLGYKKFTPRYCIDHAVGSSSVDILRLFHKLGISNTHHVLHSINAEAMELYKTELTVMPHAREVIESIKIRKCIGSNGERHMVLRSLEISGLAKYFSEDVVFTVGGEVSPKPAPDVYLHAAQQMGNVPPHNCLVIDDSPIGVQAAKAANMKAIGFAGGRHHAPKITHALLEHGACAVIKDLLEVRHYL